MKILLSLLSTLVLTQALAEPTSLSVTSPNHRVSLLELYTSEGCSSCPPADKFLSSLKQSGINNQQLIPLAFHVTYWDYIGWEDPYASRLYDDRQRTIAKFDKASTIYTPQFVLNGTDFRDYGTFSKSVRKVILQPSTVRLTLKSSNTDTKANVELTTDLSESKINNVHYYLVLYENALSSDVEDGENEGRTLDHNYVVRRVHGPYTQNKKNKLVTFEKIIHFDSKWKKEDLGLVAYAQNPTSGAVLQAVELKLF